MNDSQTDKILKRALGKARLPDQEHLTERVMARIREERTPNALANPSPGAMESMRRLWRWAQIAFSSVAAVVAIAAFVTASVLMLMPTTNNFKLTQTGPVGAPSYGPPVPPTSAADRLIAQEYSEASMPGAGWHLVCNDPLLRPHSIWEQHPDSKL